MRYDAFIHGAETLAKLVLPKFSDNRLLAFVLKVEGIELPVELTVIRPSGDILLSRAKLALCQQHDIEVQRVTLHEGVMTDGGDFGDIVAFPEVWTCDLCVSGVGEWEATVADLLFLHWQKTGHDPQEVSLTFETVKTGDHRRPLKRTFKYAWKNGVPVLVGWVNKSFLTPTKNGGAGSILGDVSKYILSSWSAPPDVLLTGFECKNLPFGGWSA